MRRQFLTLVLTGLFGALLLSSDASACHKKRCKTPQTCVTVVQPAPVCAPAPVCPPPAPVCQPAPKCGHPRKKLFGGLFHHKKQVVATTVVYAAPAPCTSCPTPSVQSVVPSGQGY